jgi:predicted YcjX-like family ATPase
MVDNEKKKLATGREYFSEGESRVPVSAKRSEKYFSPYVNNVQVGVSYYDVSVHFNRVLEANRDIVLLEELVSVVMSPEQAVDLHRALGQALQKYQERYGAFRPTPRAPQAPSAPGGE